MEDEVITSSFVVEGHCTELQTLRVSTDRIESLIRRHYQKEGWQVVDFDWPPGQWPHLVITRRRENSPDV